MPAELTDEQRRKAADLIARNWLQKDVAAEIGCSARTVQRLCNENPEFQEMVRKRREVAMSKFPEVERVLQEALAAKKDDGIDWRTRLDAAKLLINRIDPLANVPDLQPEEPEPEYYLPKGGDSADA